MLGQPPGVFQRGRRGPDALDRDGVVQSVKNCFDLPLDALVREAEQLCIAAQLGDVALKDLLDSLRYRGQLLAEPVHDRVGALGDDLVVIAASIPHITTLGPFLWLLATNGPTKFSASRLCGRSAQFIPSPA